MPGQVNVCPLRQHNFWWAGAFFFRKSAKTGEFWHFGHLFTAELVEMAHRRRMDTVRMATALVQRGQFVSCGRSKIHFLGNGHG